MSFEDFEIATGWEVDSEVAYTYPCSGGYVTNFAANDQLLKDVRGAINERGRDLGIKADCANLCDVDNGSYKLVGKDTSNEAVTGQRSIAEVYPRKIAEIFCDEEFGVLNNDNPNRDDAFNTGPNNDLNACRCDPDDELGGGKYISGCYECEGVLTFSVKSCLDSSDFSKSAKDSKKRAAKDAANVKVVDPERRLEPGMMFNQNRLGLIVQTISIKSNMPLPVAP